MIKPHKYLKIDSSVIVLGAKILKILTKTQKEKYENVLAAIINNSGEECKYIFPQALSFLFLLGKIDYIKESDELELIL